MKQAGKVLNWAITDVSKELVYEATEADNCLFMKDDGSSFILLYVDNMLIVTKDDRDYERVQKHLENKCKTSCLGNVKNYHGIYIERQDDGSFLLSQESYIERMHSKNEMEQAKPSPIPIDHG